MTGLRSPVKLRCDLQRSKLCRRVTEYVRLHEMQGATVVVMALASEIVAAFAIKDPIKPEAGAVVKALKKAGIKASPAKSLGYN